MRSFEFVTPAKLKLTAAALKSKESSTLKTYVYHFFKWKNYAFDKGLGILPAKKEDFSEFIIDMTGVLSFPTIKNCSAAVQFFHKVFGFSTFSLDSCESLIKDYVQKFSRKPCKVRDPFLLIHLAKIVDLYDFEKCSLYDLRSLGVIIVAFFGFLRYSDLSVLRVQDVIFSNVKVELIIRRSKTDKSRLGQKVIFDSESFPAKFLQTYFRRFRFSSFDPSCFVFMTVHVKSDKVVFYRSRKLLYNSASRIFSEAISKAEIEDGNFSFHSLRIGGASEASRLGVSDFRISATGRWRSDKSRLLYQRDPSLGNDSVSMVLSREFT